MSDEPKELHNLDEDLQKLIKWLAAEYGYMKEVDTELKDLKTHLDNVKANRKDMQTIKHDLRYASRSENRVERFEKKLEEDMDALAEIVPGEMKVHIQDLEKKIRIAARVLVKQVSIFEGHIREDLKKLETNLDLLAKAENKKEKDEPEISRLKGMITSAINNLIKKVESTITWQQSLSVDLEEANVLEAELSQMSAV